MKLWGGSQRIQTLFLLRNTMRNRNTVRNRGGMESKSSKWENPPPPHTHTPLVALWSLKTHLFFPSSQFAFKKEYIHFVNILMVIFMENVAKNNNNCWIELCGYIFIFHVKPLQCITIWYFATKTCIIKFLQSSLSKHYKNEHCALKRCLFSLDHGSSN